MVGQADPQEQRLAQELNEDVGMTDDGAQELPDEYMPLRNRVSWHVDVSDPVLVSQQVWAFRTPESRYGPEQFPCVLLGSIGRASGLV